MDDDIIRMALEAQQEQLSLDGRSVPSTALSGYWFSMEVADLARFAALVRADERKRIKAEPVALKHRHEWFSTGGMEPGQFRCIHCGVWGQEQTDPQIADRLARHGIPMPEGDPKC